MADRKPTPESGYGRLIRCGRTYHSPMLITLHVPGATPGQLEAGIAAAQAVFDMAGVTAAEVAMGRWAYEEWMRAGSSGMRPPEGIIEAAATFGLAERAAVDTCCGGAEPPEGCRLSMTDS